MKQKIKKHVLQNTKPQEPRQQKPQQANDEQARSEQPSQRSNHVNNQQAMLLLKMFMQTKLNNATAEQRAERSGSVVIVITVVVAVTALKMLRAMLIVRSFLMMKSVLPTKREC